MSYDLYVFRTPADRDPEEVFDEEMAIEEEGGETIDDAELDACCDAVHVALGDAGTCDRCGGHVSINIAYHDAAAQQPFISRLADCLHRTATQRGLTIFDPQEGRAIEPQRDLRTILGGVDRGVRIMRDLHEGQEPSTVPPQSTTLKKKPWWRFW